jgi:hypothetical protein
VAYTAVEVADEDYELPFIFRLIYVEGFERDIFPIFVLDDDIASLDHCFWIGQLTMSLFPFFRNTHDVVFDVVNVIEPSVFQVGVKKT